MISPINIPKPKSVGIKKGHGNLLVLRRYWRWLRDSVRRRRSGRTVHHINVSVALRARLFVPYRHGWRLLRLKILVNGRDASGIIPWQTGTRKLAVLRQVRIATLRNARFGEQELIVGMVVGIKADLSGKAWGFLQVIIVYSRRRQLRWRNPGIPTIRGQ